MVRRLNKIFDIRKSCLALNLNFQFYWFNYRYERVNILIKIDFMYHLKLEISSVFFIRISKRKRITKIYFVFSFLYEINKERESACQNPSVTVENGIYNAPEVEHVNIYKEMSFLFSFLFRFGTTMIQRNKI